jgi:aromatic-amino-acid transaminase
MIETLEMAPPDPLLKLIGLFRDDPRPDKIDLGVGVYHDASGATPVFRAVKAAEAELVREQTTKAYLGAEGDQGFLDAVQALIFGPELSAALGERLCGLQATGGTGALRLGAEIAARADAPAGLLGRPSWANHAPIMAAARLPVRWYDYFDPAAQKVRLDAMARALDEGAPGEIVVLQACCHNPTGGDLSLEEWREVTRIIVRRGLLPLIDIAYTGLGQGVEEDLAGARLLLAQAPEALVAVSGAKSFGLYRERVGALYMLATSPAAASRALSNAFAIARAFYSMPPDHGAAVVRLILTNETLKADWLAELGAARRRIAKVRIDLAGALAAAGLEFGAALASQRGMFTTLPLSQEQVLALRAERGIYMTDGARINVAALTGKRIEALVGALSGVRRVAARTRAVG